MFVKTFISLVECPFDFVLYPGNNGGDCFKLFNTLEYWDGAKAQCETFSGAHLASIQNAEENVFTRGKLRNICLSSCLNTGLILLSSP